MTKKLLLAAVCSLWLVYGCSTPDDGGGLPTPILAPTPAPGSPTPTPTPTPAMVSIVLTNQTDEEMDPKFYRSSSNLDFDTLFIDPTNLYQNFNGKTTIPAKSLATISIPFAQATTIGTDQAAFASLTTMAHGRSIEIIILHSAHDFTQNQTVTFTFYRDTLNVYRTAYSITGTP